MEKKIDPDPYGRVPHHDILSNWANGRNWYIRADELDAKATAIMEDELVKQQVMMWKEQAARARATSIMAFSYLEENGFDSAASAVSGLKWSQEEERKTRGAEAFITAIKDASSDELIKTIRQLAERHASTENDIVDSTEIDVSNVSENIEEKEDVE